jgi:hypothetical protein
VSIVARNDGPLNDPSSTLTDARRRMLIVQAEVREVIRILTAEQALRAQKVVRESGHRG